MSTLFAHLHSAPLEFQSSPLESQSHDGVCLQTTNVMTLLANPYPYGEEVVVINQTAQLVDENLRPVPLSEVPAPSLPSCPQPCRLLSKKLKSISYLLSSCRQHLSIKHPNPYPQKVSCLAQSMQAPCKHHALSQARYFLATSDSTCIFVTGLWAKPIRCIKL